MVFSKKKRYVPLLSLILSSLLAMTIPMTATAAAVSNFNSDFKYREFFSKYEYTVSSGGSGSATITGDDKNVISLTATGTGSGGCATGSDTIVTLTAKEAISITCTMKDITSCDMTADTSGSKTFDLAAGGTVSFTLHSGNSTQKSGTVTFSNVEASATKVPNDCAFYSNGSDSYAYLDEAIAAAQGGNDKTIVVTKNGTVYHSSYEKKDSNNGNYTKSFTIPDGITLLVPYDSGGTVVRDSPTTVGDDGLFDGLTGAKDEPHTAPYAYRTLTLAEDTELTINGSMSIAGKIYASDGGEIAGVPNGPVGFVNMNADSEIIVNGNLYVWGYITGSGSVTANSGSKVYENFQLAGWRGGQVTSGAENEVFPESQYYIQNIEVPLTLCAGATEIATTAVSLTGFTPVNNVNFIGPSNCMFTLSDGSITKDYIESTDRLKVDLNNATVTVSAITLESVDIGKTLKSEDYILPLTHNMTITLHSSNVICNQNLSLLPGAVLNIDAGSTFKMGTVKNAPADFYIYDAEQWGAYSWSNGNKTFIPLVSVPGRTGTRSDADLIDAEILVNGTLDANGACIYTTADGANIHSTGDGKVVNTAGTKTITYQMSQNGTTATYPKISISPAQLKNANGTYTLTAKSTTTPNTFTYTNGKWICAVHSDAEDAANICDACGTTLVAQIVGGTKYASLAAAVSTCGSNDYIQMLNNTNETISANANNDVYVDLAGKEVTLNGLTGTKKVYFMDKSTDGFGDGNGRVTGTAAASVQPHTKHEFDGITRQYVKVQAADGGYAFPRVATAVTRVGYRTQGTEGYLTFQNTYRGAPLATDFLTDMGFQFGETTAIWHGTNLTKTDEDEDTDGYTIRAHYDMAKPTTLPTSVLSQIKVSGQTVSTSKSTELAAAFEALGVGGT